MKVGLVDVDGHNFPNLPLMKLSAYHKAKGDNVEFATTYTHYDRIYMAKVFTDGYSKDDLNSYNADGIIKGGTGYGFKVRLPSEIEHIFPDYLLYNIKDTAYGYLTRGRPRGCRFCIVKEKEGKESRQVAELGEFYNGQKKIVLLDPNILACPDAEKLLQTLADTGKEVDFTQGLDIRLMTVEKAKLLEQVKTKVLHFAWDNAEDELTMKALEAWRGFFNKTERNMKVYVLVNFNTTIEQDLMRIYKLRELKYDPYVMVYEKWKAPKVTKDLQRWCNNKFVFRSCNDFADYKKVNNARRCSRN